jgi:hypothetical protein
MAALDPAGPQARLPRSPRRATWLSDFSVSNGRLKVHDTGADLALDATLIGEALVWLGYHVIVRVRSWAMRLARPNAPRVWFAPAAPRPWYLVWAAMAWAGIRITNDPASAQAAFAFEDLTWISALAPPLLPAFNYRCLDVSKSKVAAVFEQVFGYPLAVDPRTWNGPSVDKAELNGVHDGRIVDCPAPREAGRHYQRLIDTSDGAFTYDLRTACVGGRPVVVWKKRKPLADRFSIHNLSVTTHLPDEVFSAEELALIGRFLAEMRADWAGLDILRDRLSGRIYIVDVNKTDVGPIIALSLADKLRSTAMLARALNAMLPEKKTAAAGAAAA